MAVRLLGVVGAGNWSEFFRLLGKGTGPDPAASEDCGGDGSGSGGEPPPLVGDEPVFSAFAVRLRCLCHGMLLPVRAHALRAMNKAYGKSEKVLLVSWVYHSTLTLCSSTVCWLEQGVSQLFQTT